MLKVVTGGLCSLSYLVVVAPENQCGFAIQMISLSPSTSTAERWVLAKALSFIIILSHSVIFCTIRIAMPTSKMCEALSDM